MSEVPSWEQDTQEIPVVTPEMLAAAEEPKPSRLRRLGNFLLEGLAASGGGYGAARMGMYVPRPPAETKTDEDETTEGAL